MKKRSDKFEWLEICRYKVDKYMDRYNNTIYNLLKNNNIEVLSQLEIFSINNVDRKFQCSIYVQQKDYNKSIKLLE